MRDNSSLNGLLGFDVLLFLLFLGLKLGGIIHWSWWWVTAPLWIGPALVLSILIVLAIIGGLVWYFKK